MVEDKIVLTTHGKNCYGNSFLGTPHSFPFLAGAGRDDTEPNAGNVELSELEAKGRVMYSFEDSAPTVHKTTQEFLIGPVSGASLKEFGVYTEDGVLINRAIVDTAITPGSTKVVILKVITELDWEIT